MKIASALLVSLAAVMVIAGCGKKSEPVTSTPTEKPAAQSTPPPTAPTPAPEEPKVAIKDKKVGKGEAVVPGDEVTVHYKGWLDNGEVFDTSKKPGREPFTFTVGAGMVIPGWDQGLVGMKVGGVRNLVIPSSLGYGSRGQGSIPPDATLHFDVELLTITKPGPSTP